MLAIFGQGPRVIAIHLPPKRPDWSATPERDVVAPTFDLSAGMQWRRLISFAGQNPEGFSGNAVFTGPIVLFTATDRCSQPHALNWLRSSTKSFITVYRGF
jgi:hypothetical protein